MAGVVELKGRVDAEKLLGQLHHASVDGGPVRIALAEKTFLDTSGLATLAAWGSFHKEQGAAFRIDGDQSAVAYLSRMDVLDALGLERREMGERRIADGRFVTTTPLLEPDGRFTDEVCDLVLHHFDDAPAFLPAMEWAVNEIVDNVHIHADCQTPGFACAQYYPTRHRLEVAVVDLGRGLKDSLAEAHDVRDDEVAIHLAVQRGVTRDRQVGQGNGLAGTREIVQANGGSLTIWTGTSRYRLHKDGEKPARAIAPWQGTGLRLSLDTRNPVDLQQTFIEGSGWSYIDTLATSVAEEGLVVANACSFFGSRPPATRLRRKVRALLGAMEDDERLVLDFNGVEKPSSSFLDELLGRLAAELGPEEFQRRVVVRNANDVVARRANVVITQRVGEGVGL